MLYLLSRVIAFRATIIISARLSVCKCVFPEISHSIRHNSSAIGDDDKRAERRSSLLISLVRYQLKRDFALISIIPGTLRKHPPPPVNIVSLYARTHAYTHTHRARAAFAQCGRASNPLCQKYITRAIEREESSFHNDILWFSRNDITLPRIYKWCMISEWIHRFVLLAGRSFLVGHSTIDRSEARFILHGIIKSSEIRATFYLP